jgi:hypothetical protein
MEDVINEFEQFLQHQFDMHPIPSSDGTLTGMREKLEAVQVVTKELDEISTRRANELLNGDIGDVDRDELKSKLQEIGGSRIKQFIVSSFK